MKKMLAALLTTLLLLLSGCGGGGGGGTTTAVIAPASTVSGVAAAGLVISGTVYLKDSAATPKELSKTTSDGSFSFDVTGLTKPFMLRAVGTIAGGTPYTLYSLAGDAGTANVNPLSNLLVANAAASGDLAALYGATDRSSLQGVAGKLAQALTDAQSTLKPLLQKYGVAFTFDPIKDSYKADGTGLDHMLDLVQIVLGDAGTVTITDAGSPPVTRDVATGFATHAVSGVVTLGGAHLAGVTVSVVDIATGTSYGSTQTLANGGYRIVNVAQGSYTVTPTKAGYSFDRASSTVTVDATDCDVPPFLGFPSFTVSGTVASSNGLGLAGVTLSVARPGAATLSAVSDGDGRYSVGGLTNGDYTITPSRSDVFNSVAVGFAPAARAFSIGSGANYAVADFTASLASFTVSGSVTRLSGGAAMPGVTLYLVTKTPLGVLLNAGDAVFTALTDASGNYSLKGIPSGYYALTPTLTPDLAFALSGASSPVATADNFLVNGADTRMDFTGRPTSDATGGVHAL